MPEVEMLSSGDAAAEGVFSGGVTQPAGADAQNVDSLLAIRASHVTGSLLPVTTSGRKHKKLAGWLCSLALDSIPFGWVSLACHMCESICFPDPSLG